MLKLNIKTKIILGFGTLLVLTGVIGITAIRQINSINKEVEDIYNHPFTVSNAVRDINISIYAAHRSMKDVAMASDMKQFNQSIELVNEYDAKGIIAFDIVMDRFLGDKKIVSDALQSYTNWRSIRAEVIQLKLESLEAETDSIKKQKERDASNITMGKGADHVSSMLLKTKILTDYAANKAVVFRGNALNTREDFYTTFIILFISVLVIAILAILAISNSISKPIVSLTNYAHKLTQDLQGFKDKEALLRLSKRKDEVGNLGHSFYQMTSALETTLDKLNATLVEKEKIAGLLLGSNKRMEDELNVAKDIQMSMLPLIFPAFPKRKDIDIFAELIPAREVGGDFYDFFFLDDNHFCFVVGDVSGKGVPAALMMAVCKTLIKSKAANDKSTASIMTQVNTEMARENTNYMFVTVFIGILNTQTGELKYTNAGHNPTYIKKTDGSFEKLSVLHGPVIAAMEGLSYKETLVTIETGDSIFAYTDGIPEAHNVQDELYGNETLDDFILNNRFISPQIMIEDVIESVHNFEGEADKYDDLTALCIQYHGNEGGPLHREIVTINNNIPEVQTVIEKFETFASSLNLPKEITMKMSIVFDELLANIIKYAFDDKNVHSINIVFNLSQSKLILVIEDDGVPFNPFQIEPPDTMLGIEERAIGGLGLHIVKSLMDEQVYTRITNKNIITLVKYDVLST